MRVCKLTPPALACRMCVDTWETLSGDISQMPNCNTCTYNTREYEVLDFASTFFGTGVLVAYDGKVQRVNISRIRDLREV